MSQNWGMERHFKVLHKPILRHGAGLANLIGPSRKQLEIQCNRASNNESKREPMSKPSPNQQRRNPPKPNKPNHNRSGSEPTMLYSQQNETTIEYRLQSTTTKTVLILLLLKRAILVKEFPELARFGLYTPWTHLKEYTKISKRSPLGIRL